MRKKRFLPSQQYLKECFDYDPQTGAMVWKVRPVSHFVNQGACNRINSRCAGRPVGSIHDGRRQMTVDSRCFSTARVIWKWMSNEEPPEVDHKDGNPFNEIFDNLRAATHIQNCCNRLGPKGRKTPKGIRFRKNGWEAAIQANGKNFYLGRFKKQEEAEAAYAEAAHRLHGDFAKTGVH